MESFSIPIANKIFSVTVLILIYYCDQFVAPEIRHSRCHCSVCQQTTYTVTRIEELKAVDLKCILFAFLSMSVDYLLKFDFLIFQGGVAARLM